jgi:hypothetical protein
VYNGKAFRPTVLDTTQHSFCNTAIVGALIHVPDTQ